MATRVSVLSLSTSHLVHLIVSESPHRQPPFFRSLVGRLLTQQKWIFERNPLHNTLTLIADGMMLAGRMPLDALLVSGRGWS